MLSAAWNLPDRRESAIAARAMRVTFLWTEISGYMAACWRALQDLDKCEVQIISYPMAGGSTFAADVMAGLAWRQLPQCEWGSERHVRAACTEAAPDVLMVPGWMNRAYRAIPRRGELRDVPAVMTMDTPWRGSARQYLARIALSGYLGRIDHVLVPGERAYQYARHLGFSDAQISHGLYGHDDQPFRAAAANRTAWPRAFVFVGRYETYKGLDLLADAYLKYRATVSDPWALICCGAGSLKPILAGRPGIRDLGFVQPADLPRVLKEGSVFVLPSRAESWGVALAEGCSSGVPVITTHGVGASVELVRDGYNGAVVPSNSVDGLQDAMRRMHDLSSETISQMGRRSIELSAPFGAREWAGRLACMLERVWASSRMVPQ